ncbi:MAG: metallophosphoesterase [Chitinophagales bacterium]|nr:metallophosphoesterase [Chitinophagales bacterium]
MLIILGVVIFGLILLYVLFFERYFVETNSFDIGKDKNKCNSEIKIFQVTDMHLKSINYPVFKVAEKINSASPDLLLLTGDMLENPSQLPLLDQFLSLIEHHIPKIAVNGNWEIFGQVDFQKLNTIYKKHNCLLLNNESTQLEIGSKKISITGVDDFLDGHPDINLALETYRESDYHIVLSHCPGYAPFIAHRENTSIPVNLILSGHTHGGQINILGFMPHLPGACGGFIRGWYDFPDSQLYVSKGVGTSIFPIRIGARAEITCFNLFL